MRIIIGVMGPEKATEVDLRRARELGKFIAKEGWVLLSGGRSVGVMDAVNRGAKESGGLTVGVLPAADRTGVSEAVDISIVTGMGSARNVINVLSSDVVIACGIGAGTASEIAHALRAGKHVVLLTDDEEAKVFFRKLGGELVSVVMTPSEAVEKVRERLGRTGGSPTVATGGEGRDTHADESCPRP